MTDARDRVDAALASKGTSSDRIHEVAFAEIVRAGLDHGAALDFGSGTGVFARRLAKSGRFERVVGADIARFGEPPLGAEWVEADLNGRLPAEAASFDLIVAIEVIEHLENPRAVCREWSRLLRPGGSVVMTTPNNESIRAIFSLLFRHHFIAFGNENYPAHITALVRTDLARALDEAGLRLDHVFYSDDGCVPRLTRLTWQQLSVGRLRGVRFSDNLGCVAIKRRS